MFPRAGGWAEDRRVCFVGMRGFVVWGWWGVAPEEGTGVGDARHVVCAALYRGMKLDSVLNAKL